MSWDQLVALGYAAEQLFMAAQLLTSDTVAIDSGLRRSCEHLQRLIEHQELLPRYLATWTRDCLQNCREFATGNGHGSCAEHAQQLSGAILQLLDEVRRVLNEHAGQPATPELRAA